MTDPTTPAELVASPRRAGLATVALAALLLLPTAAPAAPPGSPAVTASAGVLLDLATGQVVYAKNAEEGRAPASLVKLMTLFLAYEDLRAGKVRLEDPVIITPNAEQTPRYRMGLVAGQVVPFEILLAGVAIASANDAATAVAEHLAGSEELFVERMNATAAEMGLEHTRFANPHGLPDPRQRTTARDLGRLAQHLLVEHPESRKVLGQTAFTWRGRLYQRRISLFRDPGGVDALKTGYTLEAGYNLAVAAARAGSRYLAIILGAETRGLSFVDAGRLLKFGFGEPAKEIRRPPRRWRVRGGPTAARPVTRPVGR
ncbi:MAG: D-alanyl-D-alanine carboxypeptidase [Candidatus Rokubacteria bacterium]|nr:D-alanyl-D-alanine carboxypeptidase [Candidatus Rokubacteria bacterium]